MYLYKGQTYNNDEIKPIKQSFQHKKAKASALKSPQLSHKQILESDRDGVEEISEIQIRKNLSVSKTPVKEHLPHTRKIPTSSDPSQGVVHSEIPAFSKKVNDI